MSVNYSAKLIFGHVVKETEKLYELIKNGEIDDELIPYVDCNNKIIFGILIKEARDDGEYIVSIKSFEKFEKEIKRARKDLKAEYITLEITDKIKDDLILVCDDGY